MTTVPLRPSARANRLGDVAGRGLSAGPRIESLEEAIRFMGDPGNCDVVRADGDLIDVRSIAPGFICVPMVCDSDSAKKAPDVVDDLPVERVEGLSAGRTRAAS